MTRIPEQSKRSGKIEGAKPPARPEVENTKLPDVPQNSKAVPKTMTTTRPDFAVLYRVLGDIAGARAFLVWRAVPRGDGSFDKMPCNPDNGSTAKPNSARDRAVLTLREAEAAVDRLRGEGVEAGVGVLCSRAGITALDLDRVIKVNGRQTVEGWADWLAAASYAERSPGGKGLRVLFLGVPSEVAAISNGHERNQIGVYGDRAAKFVTLTGLGLHAGQDISDMSDEVAQRVLDRFKKADKAKGLASRPWTGAEAHDGYPRGVAGMDAAQEDILSGAVLHPALTAFLVRAVREYPIDEAEELAWSFYHDSEAKTKDPERWADRAGSIPGIIKWIKDQGAKLIKDGKPPGYIQPLPSEQKRQAVKGLIVSLAEARAARLDAVPEAEVIESQDSDFDPEDVGPGPWILQSKALFGPDRWRYDLTEDEAREVQLTLGVRWQESGVDGALAVDEIRKRDGTDKKDRKEDEKIEFKFVAVGDLEFREPEFLVDGLIETDGLGLIFGDPGSAKSFLAVDLALCVATGADFHGREVMQGSVFLIAGEGHNGLTRRFKAWSKERGRSLAKVPLFKSERAAFFLHEETMKAVAEAVDELAAVHGVPRMIVVDTVARNFGAGDENSTMDMNFFINAVDDLKARYPGSVVLLVHHSGHADKTRARGAMALKGALDFEFRVEKDDKHVRVMNTKMKDAEPPADLHFTLESIELSGNAKSAVLRSGEAPPKKPKALTRNQKMALETFESAAREHGIWNRGEDGKETFAGLHVEDWRDAFYAKHTGDSLDGKRKAFQRVRDDLIEGDHLRVESDIYTVVGHAIHTRLNLSRNAGRDDGENG